MARPGRPERNKAARSFRQLMRFHHVINSDKVFGTHTLSDDTSASVTSYCWLGYLIGSAGRRRALVPLQRALKADQFRCWHFSDSAELPAGWNHLICDSGTFSRF